MGVFSTVGDILSTAWGCSVLWGISLIHVGDIMSTVEVFSNVGDIISCYLNTMEDIMIHVGDIMSTAGVFSTMEVLE